MEQALRADRFPRRSRLHGARDFRRDDLPGGGDRTICDISSYKEIIAPHSSERTEYLSPREKQLLRRFAQGKTDERIGIEFGRTTGHISAQRLRIMKKFRLESQVELAALADKVAWPTRR
jgi:DNA-binding CsgD family transcriptional regulator